MNMGNAFGFPNTIFGFPGRDEDHSNLDDVSTSSSSPDLSSSSSDSEEDLTTDVTPNAGYNQSTLEYDTARFKSPELQITLETVTKIENDLEFYEFISMIFLLYDNKELALQVIFVAIISGKEGLNLLKGKLYEWAQTEPNDWRVKLVEALAVIQNYKILQKLGYSKTEINSRFQPTKDAALYLSRPKRMLYTVCESLNAEETKQLIKKIRNDSKFISDSSMHANLEPIYMEYYILFWISRGFLSIEKELKLEGLTNQLRAMGFLNKADEINCMVKSINKKKMKLFKYPKCEDDDGVYAIKDANNVGFCLIINMVKFEENRETRLRFQSLLPEERFADRVGSIEDVKSLIETFSMLKFDVEVEHDIVHDKLLQRIEELVLKHFKKDLHSVFVLCFLSHGDKGSIYAANSIAVRIEDINNSISGDTRIASIMRGKPKVVIIQACQGREPLLVYSELQTVDSNTTSAGNPMHVDGGECCFDGLEESPRSIRNLLYSDVLICQAIIEGYVAVRGLATGTKYIQELCRCLKKYHKRDHFVDILTRVHKKLSDEDMHIKVNREEYSSCKTHPKCACVYMIPIHKSTFNKKLFLVKQ